MIRVNKGTGVKIQGPFSEIICDFINAAGGVQLMVMECVDKGEINEIDQFKIGEAMTLAMLKIFTSFNKEDLLKHRDAVSGNVNEALLAYYKAPVATAEVNENVSVDVERNNGTESFSRVINMQDFLKGRGDE